jgi:4-diphosphocytidyl-2-C-methyl-D-erythritol kinase
MTTIDELARAKVNLTLRVRGRRPDGYHEIESLIVFADIGDGLRLEPGAPAVVRSGGPFGSSITGQNLIATALARLDEAEPRLVLGTVTLDKRLPVAAGLGGGSADAAALLRAVARANPTLSDSVDWLSIAASLGADVPVCLASAPALVRGVGEQVTPLPGLPRLNVVLVNPLVPVPPDKTARVFARLGAPPIEATCAAPLVSPTQVQTTEGLLALMRAEGNDLATAAAAIVPGIALVQAAMAPLQACMAVCLSGAGPTCFGVFPGAREAASAAAQLARSHPDWWIQPSILGP